MSESKFSLIDLRALSEPACKLIDAVCNCIGTLYEPTRIRRKAKAEADAALILAGADAERQALLKRAAHRLAIQEVRRQKNLESIISQAIESLPGTVSKEPVDSDWVSRFFEECKDVSNEELQKIWAKILASEVAKPNSCSRKTLSILKDLTPIDATIFENFCSLAWNISGYYFFCYDKGIRATSQLEKYGVDYGQLLHLENLGLIHCKKDILMFISFEEQISYFDFDHICYVYPNNMVPEISCYPLTDNGNELLKVINREFNIDFYIDWIKLFSNIYSVYLTCPMQKV